ncbi:MAG: class I SAM-dependent methyltransferase, partial [Bdellovibrionales bacterium]|nr:class I SAM-dependent methyltransferase [Bdellovibrionales bacterium]
MSEQDAYIKYIQDFFGKWVAVYDLFAASIFYAYSHAVKVVDPQPGMNILDICTGTGEIAVRCAKAGATVTGIDITEAMLARAQKKAAGLPATFLTMDARNLEFSNAAFDAAIISFGLHDMPRKVRLAVLTEASRVAKR